MTNQTDKHTKLATYFILGYPRSGTTWFANLFNSHPDVVYRHEMIGRCYQDFPEELFKKLKFSYSLSNKEYKEAINIILSPNVESDRAPFFKKNHLILNSPQFHYIFWVFSKAIPIFKTLYKFLFYPRSKKLTLVIKETRSSVNMDSFIKGIRADKNVILFRHPCGAIASSLNGIKEGKMQASTSSQREQWTNEDKTRQYISKIGLTPTDIELMPEHEYLAIRWRLQNEDYLDFSAQDIDNIYINYENFMLNQKANIKALFSKLALSYDNGVERFLQTSSGIKRTKPLLKDSSSSFYSVYKSEGFDPNKWQKSLTPEQINDIEKHSIDTFNKLIEFSSH